MCADGYRGQGCTSCSDEHAMADSSVFSCTACSKDRRVQAVQWITFLSQRTFLFAIGALSAFGAKKAGDLKQSSIYLNQLMAFATISNTILAAVLQTQTAKDIKSTAAAPPAFRANFFFNAAVHTAEEGPEVIPRCIALPGARSVRSASSQCLLSYLGYEKTLWLGRRLMSSRGRVKKKPGLRVVNTRSPSLGTLQIGVLPYSFWDFGATYQFIGEYWGSTCNAVGRLECITLGSGGAHAQILLKGTDSQELKAWAESVVMSGSIPEMSVHLYPANCPKTALARGALHGTAVRSEDTGAAWAWNVEKIVAPVELGGEGALERDIRDIAQERREPAIHKESREADRENLKTGHRSFKGTPLDTKCSVRSLLRNRRKKKKKSKKAKKDRRSGKGHHNESSSSQSNNTISSSSSGGTINSTDSEHPFKEGHRVKRLAKKIPGILCRHALDEMSRLLVQHVGEESTTEMKPVLLRYLRLHVMMKSLLPAQKRELLTLGYAVDKLLRRDVLGALDLMIQRVKAIELVLGGSTWAVAQNLELVPLEQEMIASIAEAQGDWKGKKGDGKKGDGKRKWGVKGVSVHPWEPPRTPGAMGEGFISDSLSLSAVILETLLGGCDCGFSSVVSKFCEGKEACMVGERAARASIFPLPLPDNQDITTAREKKDGKKLWLFLLLVGLNYLNAGQQAPLQSFKPSSVQQGILDYLDGRVDAFLSHSFNVSKFDWGKFLRTKTISYTNEEVRTAKWTSWKNIKPALPYGHIGAIPAIELADGGVLDLLSDPRRYLRPNWDQHAVRSSRVMVTDEDWGELARGMVEFNLCSVLPKSALACASGHVIHNGLFGVEKGEEVDGVEVHRLIMNLIPMNSVSMPVVGDVATLPLLHQMCVLQLHPDEELVVSSEDIRCMFYIFSLPPVWLPFLSFNKPVPADLVPPHVQEECFLCAKVLPMGYLNSVGEWSRSSRVILHPTYRADIDGKLGTGRPKGEKLGKYVSAALSLLRRARCSQKEIQIVGGGAVQSEILVFLALLLLAHLDFRKKCRGPPTLTSYLTVFAPLSSPLAEEIDFTGLTGQVHYPSGCRFIMSCTSQPEFTNVTLNHSPGGEVTALRFEDVRLNLLGNAWSVAVVGFLLLQLLRPRQLCMLSSLQELLSTLYGDKPVFSDALLSWHSLRSKQCCPGTDTGKALAAKLMTLLSSKGSDIMIQSGTEPRDFQRFRNSIPARLWSWKTITGWPWPDGEADHINRYEMRAVYTALRWRVLRRKECRVRFVHLTDSMVSLHVINRGRSSSRKLQSLMYRLSSLLLAAGLHPFLAYVSTDTNPADRKVERQQLGTLRANTVATRTRQRYDAALTAFYLYAQTQRIRIPDEPEPLDSIFADYIECLWEEGESFSLATDGLSGLQDLRPRLRGKLALSWRLVRTWQRKEIPHRAPPLPEDVLQALCGYFLFLNKPFLALALEVAFYGVLRTGELLHLTANQVEVSPSFDCAVLSLGATKTSQRSGVSDSALSALRLTSWAFRPFLSLLYNVSSPFTVSKGDRFATPGAVDRTPL
ncbi:Tnks2, partial [Symbiodinium necroappetens]